MIVYASRTGNVEWIVEQLKLPHKKIHPDLEVQEPYLLITYTDGLGTIPKQVEAFLKKNVSSCKGVVVSGNTNFGHHNFGGAGDKISSQYHIPLVHKIDLRGSKKDYEIIKNFYEVME